MKEEKTMKDQELLELIPVRVTEDRVIGEHMASLLGVGTIRLGAVSGKR